MNTESSKTIAAHVDESRQELCGVLAQTLHDGCIRMRVRVPKAADEAWFYRHHDNKWDKLNTVLRGPGVVQALNEQLVMLATKPHGDELQVTQHAAADWHDTEFLFHRQKLDEHEGEKLKSYLYGLLFRDHHDSGHDVRRHVRSGLRRGQTGH